MPIILSHSAQPYTETIFHRALEEARLMGQDLHVVQVLPEPSASATSSVKRWQADVETARAHPPELLDGAPADVHVEFHVEALGAGSVSEGLLRHAHRVGASLIVLPVPRRSRVGKLVLGSTAQQVLLEADCPVLAVPPATDG